MPRMYRIKACPVCGKEHRKEGKYCCREHYKIGSIGEKRSEETKQKQSASHKRYKETEKGRIEANMFVLNSELIKKGEEPLTLDDYIIDIPTDEDLDAEEKINW